MCQFARLAHHLIAQFGGFHHLTGRTPRPYPGLEVGGIGDLDLRRVLRLCDHVGGVGIDETDDDIVIKIEIAGMHEEDFRISLDGRLLHITGLRRDLAGKLAYQHLEINYGEFRLDVRLPHAVAESEVRASYEKGFLFVFVPRHPRQRRIPVTEANNC